MKTNKNFLQLKNCIPGTEDSLLKRAVFEGGGTVPEKRSEKPQGFLETLAELMDKQKPIDTAVDFEKNPQKMRDVLKTLAEKAYPNFKAIHNIYTNDLLACFEEQAKGKDGGLTLSKYWEWLGNNKVTKIQLNNGRINFLTEEGSKLTWENFAIKPSLPHLTETKTTGDKKVSVENIPSLEEKGQTRISIIEVNSANQKNIAAEIQEKLGRQLKNGDKFLVRQPKFTKEDKTVVEARNYYVVYKDGQFLYTSQENQNKPAFLISGTKIEVQTKIDKVSKEKIQTETTEKALYEKHRIANVWTLKFDKGETYDDLIRAALNKDIDKIDPKFKEKKLYSNLENNKKIGELRTKTAAMSVDDYKKLLKDEGAYNESNGKVYLIIPTEKKDDDRVDADARKAKVDQQMDRYRQGYFMVKEFRNDPIFKMEDPKLVKLVNDPKAWKEAWDSTTAINGVTILKGIIASEPLFEKLKTQPDLVRMAVLRTITDGLDKRVYISDVVNILMKEMEVRVPSYTVEAKGEKLALFNKQKNFSEAKSDTVINNNDYNKAFRMTEGFLSKLGPDALKSAKYLNQAKAGVLYNPEIVVSFIFEGHIYNAKIQHNKGIGANEISLYHQDGTPIRTRGESEKKWTETEYLSSDNSEKNPILAWFRNTVTPLVNYKELKSEFDKYFDENGNPKKGSPMEKRPDLIKFYKDLVIGSNRISYQLREMKFDQKALETFKQERIEAQTKDAKEFEKQIGPEMYKLLNNVFPNEIGNRSWNDVLESEALEEDTRENLTRSSGAYAFRKFLKMSAGPDGKIDETTVLTQLRDLLQKGYAKLPEIYKDPKELTQKTEEIVKALGVKDGDFSNLNFNTLKAALGRPEENEPVIRAIQKGFSSKIMQMDRISRIDKAKDFAEAVKKYEKIPEAERKQFEEIIRKHLEEKGLKGPALEREVKNVVEKTIPIIPFLGYDAGNFRDVNTHAIGVGVGLNFPVSLGQNGEYGTMLLGGGAGLGIPLDGSTVRVGLGTGVGYQTPHFGPFSIVSGVGAGLGWSAEKGWQVGMTGGVAVDVELGHINSFKIHAAPGVVATNFGILPGFVIGGNKDHAYSIAEIKKETLKAARFEEIDQISDRKQKAQAIMKIDPISKKDTILRSAVIAEDPSLANANLNSDPAAVNKILNIYEQHKADLLASIEDTYDPGIFQGIDVGFGITSEGKFVFGASPSFDIGRVFGAKRKTYMRALKGGEEQEAEITRGQLVDILSKKNQTTEDKEFLKQQTDIGNLVMDPSGHRMLLKETQQVAPVEITGTIDSEEKLKNRLNEMYKPLGIEAKLVTVNENGKNIKLFQLNFKKESDTNYQIAVDPAMNEGGLVFKDGNIYLSSKFDYKNPPVILRGDYEYPEPVEGVHNVAIFSVSDRVPYIDKDTKVHGTTMEIYRSAPQLLVSRNGKPFQKEDGFQAATTIESQGSRMKAEDRISDRFDSNFDLSNRFSAIEKFENKKEETARYLERLKTAAPDIGEEKYTTYETFAADFEKAHKIDYRKLSNAETNTYAFKKLNELIIKDWKDKGHVDPLKPEELSLIRALIVDASFKELGEGKTNEERIKFFKERLEVTREITKQRFKEVVERNNKKYPSTDDPRHINTPYDTLADTAIARVSKINVNSKEGAINVSEVDRFFTMVSTENQRGFRGTIYPHDVAVTKMLLGPSENYAEALKNPDTLEADLAKFMLESFSPIEEMDTKSDKDFGNPKKVEELLKDPLLLQVTGLLESPITQKLFLNPEDRDSVIEIVATGKATLDANERRAMTQMYKIIAKIRKEQASGKESWIVPDHPEFRFVWNLEAKDGVYNKCTNYTYWINEKMGLEIQTEKTGVQAGYAAKGDSMNLARVSYQKQVLKFGFAHGVAGRPEAAPTEGGGQTKVSSPTKTTSAVTTETKVDDITGTNAEQKVGGG